MPAPLDHPPVLEHRDHVRSGHRRQAVSDHEDRPIGGLGVHLVMNVMDRVSYERRGANNVVLLEKQLEPAKE